LAANLLKEIGITRPVLALSIARMADAMGNSIIFIIIPLYVAKLPELFFPLPVPVLVGLLVSLYGLVNSLLQPLMGALSDRIGRRKLLIQAGLALLAIGTFAFIYAVRFLDLMILRIIQGIGLAMTVTASMALMAAITKKENRGGSMGIYTTLRMAGFAIGPLIGGFLKVHLGFDAAFYAATAFILSSMLLVQIWVKDVSEGPFFTETDSKSFHVFDKSLLNAGILSAAMATFLMASSFSMVVTLENEFNEFLHMNAFDFSIAFSALMIGRLVFQVPLGRLSDYIGRKPLVLGGLLLMAPATVLLGEANTMLELTLIRIFQGIAAACIAAPAFAIAADLAKVGGEGRQMSIITTGFGLGIAFGPLLAGILAVFFFELPFLIGGMLSTIGAYVVYRYMPETVRGKAVFFKDNH
jgi:MFS family permease